MPSSGVQTFPKRLEIVSPIRVLILEDDEGVATLQRGRLVALGYQVDVASSSREAYAALQKTRYGLLIIDYRLNESLSGLDFYRKLTSGGDAIPAILVTGLGHDEVLAEAMREGIRGFVLKTPNYWRDLEDTVRRVTRQVSLERQALETEAILESEAKLQAAFDAAAVGHFRWEPEAALFTISKIVADLFGLPEVSNISTAQFFELVHPDDRMEVVMSFEEMRVTGSPIFREYRIVRPNGEVRWLSTRGSGVEPRRGASRVFTGIIGDVTSRKEAEQKLVESYSEIQLLNERLRASMIETHHRVKNSLQIVSSLLNMELRRKPTISASEVQKLVSHIQAFAALHEILGEQSSAAGDGDGMKRVFVDDLIRRLLEILGPLAGDRLQVERLDPARVTARQSSALGILVNELVSNALKHGEGKIYLRLTHTGGRCTLSVRNEGSSFPLNFQPEKTGRSGLTLMKTIVRAELESELEFSNPAPNSAEVLVSFPLPGGEMQHELVVQ